MRLIFTFFVLFTRFSRDLVLNSYFLKLLVPNFLLWIFLVFSPPSTSFVSEATKSFALAVYQATHSMARLRGGVFSVFWLVLVSKGFSTFKQKSKKCMSKPNPLCLKALGLRKLVCQRTKLAAKNQFVFRWTAHK